MPFSTACLPPCTDDLLMLTVQEDCHKHLYGRHVVWVMINFDCLLSQNFRFLNSFSLCCRPVFSDFMLSPPSVKWEMWSNTLIVFQARFLVPVQESCQSRRVVVSHNVDKSLKEGKRLALLKKCLKVFYDYVLSTLIQFIWKLILCVGHFGQYCRLWIIVYGHWRIEITE